MSGVPDPDPLLYRRRTQRRPGLTRADIHNVGFFAIMLSIMGLAGWLYLYQTSTVALYARQIRDLEQEKERLRREIVVLGGQVARLGSLERVLGVGEKLGYHLPGASEATHRLRLVYEPPSRPGIDEGPMRSRSDLAAEVEGDSKVDGKGLWQRLVTGLEAWITSSPEDGE